MCVRHHVLPLEVWRGLRSLVLLCCSCHLASGARGVACCYLGSGQTDPAVLAAALAGKYRLVYACPETLVGMQAKLQRLHLLALRLRTGASP